MIVEISVKGIDQALARISALSSPDHSRLLRMLGLKLEQQTVRHFDIGAGPDGPWAPTQRGGQILVDTGRLRGSIQHMIGSNVIRVGTSVPYGRYHQTGTSRMPKRAFIGVSPADRDELRAIIVEHLERLVAA